MKSLLLKKSNQVISLAILAVAVSGLVALAGCVTTNTNLTLQYIYEVAWLPDESGMLTVLAQQTTSAVDGSTLITGGLFHVATDGTVGDQINMADQQILSNHYPPVIGISKDSRSAIVQVGNNIYRVDLHENTSSVIISQQNLLGVSASLKYVLTTTSPAYNTGFFYKTGFVYDITQNPPRLVNRFTMNGVIDSRAIWLGDSVFAYMGQDSTFRWLFRIYDTTGRVVRTITHAVTPFHASAYAPLANALFVRNDSSGIDRINLTDGSRSLVVPDTIESFDVNSSGSLVVFALGGAAAYSLYAFNTANGHSANLASDAFTTALSPSSNRVAYIQNQGGVPAAIKVVSVSVP